MVGFLQVLETLLPWANRCENESIFRGYHLVLGASHPSLDAGRVQTGEMALREDSSFSGRVTVIDIRKGGTRREVIPKIWRTLRDLSKRKHFYFSIGEARRPRSLVRTAEIR